MAEVKKSGTELKKPRKARARNKRGQLVKSELEGEMDAFSQLLPPEFEGIRMTKQEFEFIHLYTTNGFNAHDAIIGAGFEINNRLTVDYWTRRIFQREGVLAALKKLVENMVAPYKETFVYRTLMVYHQRAFYDISTFYDDDGKPKPLNEIDKDWRCCIDDVYEKGRYKLPNRDNALSSLVSLVQGNENLAQLKSGDTSGFLNEATTLRIKQIRALITEVETPALLKKKTNEKIALKEA